MVSLIEVGTPSNGDSGARWRQRASEARAAAKRALAVEQDQEIEMRLQALGALQHALDQLDGREIALRG